MTTLTLGQFTFQDFEIPESIQFGGEQRLTVHKLQGGARVVDAMGADPVAPSWGGIFLGPQAMSRALTLKSMYEGAQQYQLGWDVLSYQVIIQAFIADFRRPYYVPYHIACMVVQDTTASQTGQGPSVDDDINADAASATVLTNSIGNAPLSAAMGTLNTAIGAVSDFAKASSGVINSVLQPLAAAQSQCTTLIAQVDKTLLNVTTVGGLLPGNPISTTVAQFANYSAAATQQPLLVQLNRLYGRMGTNIGQINSSIRTITVPGGNLFDLASKYYGDPSGWTAIASANPALKGDPQLSGITTLVIPPYTNKTGGVR
jgi:hypothetical protein